MSKKLKTSVTLDSDLLDRLKVEAAREHRSLSSLVEIWLEAGLEIAEEQEKPTKGDGE